MKKMFVILLLIALPAIGRTDTIFFKNGTRLDVDKAWKESGQVKCEMYGGIVSYPAEDVDRVEKSTPVAPGITSDQPGDTEIPKGTGLRTSYREVDKIRDVSMHGGLIKRIVANIVIPLGRTEEEVCATLKRAAIEIGTRERAKATTVKGYRPQDNIRTGVQTAGQATYAPNGKWEDASIKAPMAVTVEFGKNSLYFKKDEPLTKAEERQDFILTSKSSEPIRISSKRDSWVDTDIIAKIRSGTPVLILQRHKEAISPEMLFVRCRVRVNWKGKKIEGWVHDYNITKKN